MLNLLCNVNAKLLDMMDGLCIVDIRSGNPLSNDAYDQLSQLDRQ